MRTNSLRRCFWQGVCGVWGVSSQQARAKRAGAEPARRCPWSGEAGAGPATCAPAGLPLCSHLPGEGLAGTGHIPRPRANGRLTGPFPGLPAAVQMPSSCPHIRGRESRTPCRGDPRETPSSVFSFNRNLMTTSVCRVWASYRVPAEGPGSCRAHSVRWTALGNVSTSLEGRCRGGSGTRAKAPLPRK